MTQPIRPLALFAVLSFLLTACATGGAFLRAGERAELAQDYDQAVVEYTKAFNQNPDDRTVRLALDRTKLRAAQDHFLRGRRLQAGGRLDEAMVELQLAAELNPGSGDIDNLLRDVRVELRNKVAVSRDGKTQLESLIDRSRDFVPSGTELPSGLRLPASLIFRDASSRDVYTAMTRFAGLNVVFDPQFRDQPISIDLRDSSLESALGSVSQATRNFYKVSAQRTVTVIPDTPAKRQEYEEEIVRTFYLSNADLKETIDMLRIVMDSRRIAPVTATNALSIKDTPDRVTAAGKLIAAIDKAKPEVVIDVELLEVDRTRLREYGLQLASPGSAGIDGAIDINQEGTTLRDLRNLTQSGISLTNLPGLFYRLLKSDNNTRTLANPQLRTSDGVSAQARFGERVPVPVTTFAPLATGGAAQQPITSYNYENIGVNIDIRPRTHHDDEVTLELKIAVSSISGTGFSGLPTFGNREINTEIRLRDGETNLLAGLIRDDERKIVEGVPGLSDLPLIGRLFAHSRRETQETDIVLTLTPHIVRVLDLNESDLRPFRVGGNPPTATLELPIQIPALQAAPEPLQPASDAQPNPEPSVRPADPVTPIRPPVSAPTPLR